jgi:ubiquitin carboxyl-terminal hydrolase 5/13
MMLFRYAKDLKQLDNGVMVQKTGWKCSRCDLTENLWMNLTSGVILCGRKNWDGSGGNGHAMEYFNETGYPLAVKLGTISPDSPADVYSYAENNEVLDPHLDKHLAHFGIDIGSMKKVRLKSRNQTESDSD